MTAPLLANDVSALRAGTPVLQQFALSAQSGTLTVLFGPNGAGKTTALKVLAGLLPYLGQVTLFGQDARSLTPRQRARQLSYVPQQSALATGACVRDVVAQGRYAHASWAGWSRQASPAVARALELCHVTQLAERAFRELSGGEQRRVLLARALATEAPIVLLDEPTSGLDVAYALRFLSLLRELAASGLTLIVVLHDLEQVRSCADAALLMAAGKVVASGATETVLRPDLMRAVYGIELVQNAGFGYRLYESGP